MPWLIPVELPLRYNKKKLNETTLFHVLTPASTVYMLQISLFAPIAAIYSEKNDRFFASTSNKQRELCFLFLLQHIPNLYMLLNL